MSLDFLSDAKYAADGGRLLFATHSAHVWITDGTPAGTLRVLPLGDSMDVWSLAAHGGRFYFLGQGRPSEEARWRLYLWTSDGTRDGTGRLHDLGSSESNGLYGAELKAAGNRVYFSAYDPEHGHELWWIDPAIDETPRIFDLWPGAVGSVPRGLTVTADRLYFTAVSSEHGRELWTLPLTDPPTVRFRRADAAVDLSDAIAILSFLFNGGPTLPCADAADANDSGVLDLSDAIYTLDFLFLGTSEPPAPFGRCGADPTGNTFDCEPSSTTCN